MLLAESKREAKWYVPVFDSKPCTLQNRRRLAVVANLALLPRFPQGLIRRFQPVIEERIAGGPEQYQSQKDKYFQEAWSGEPFKNQVRLMQETMAQCAHC